MSQTHETAIKVDVYTDELMPVLKLLNLALMCKDVTMWMSEEQLDKIYGFKDDWATLALEYKE